ncbi:hypothetical protein KSP40_PGU020465 [Platanthera guangdongensis]|uniref:BRO1 domain-containing protein n=1 Tax=Platanthera guangdongensis TaxID=2320717 RepID=A0ABR2LRA9_9ASPA
MLEEVQQALDPAFSVELEAERVRASDRVQEGRSRRRSIDVLLKAAGYLDCAIHNVLPQIPLALCHLELLIVSYRLRSRRSESATVAVAGSESWAMLRVRGIRRAAEWKPRYRPEVRSAGKGGAERPQRVARTASVRGTAGARRGKGDDARRQANQLVDGRWGSVEALRPAVRFPSCAAQGCARERESERERKGRLGKREPGVDIQLGMAIESPKATLAVKRRLACEMVKYWLQAAAYYYHGLILDEGNTEKSHGMAVAALQAADGFLKESKNACEVFHAAPPTSRCIFLDVKVQIPNVKKRTALDHDDLHLLSHV